MLDREVLRFSVILGAISLLLKPSDAAAQTTQRESYNEAAVKEFVAGRYTESEKLLRAAIMEAESTGIEDPTLARMDGLARVLEALGKDAEAEPLYKRALTIAEQKQGSVDPNVAIVSDSLAEIYASQGKYAEAEQLYRRVLAIREQTVGPDDPTVAEACINLARIDNLQNNFAETETLLKRALVIRERTLGADNLGIAMVCDHLSRLYASQARYAEADELSQRALLIMELKLSPNDPGVASVCIHLAILCRSQGKYAEAETLYNRALAIREEKLGLDHPEVAAACSSLAFFFVFWSDLTKQKFCNAGHCKYTKRNCEQAIQSLQLFVDHYLPLWSVSKKQKNQQSFTSRLCQNCGRNLEPAIPVRRFASVESPTTYSTRVTTHRPNPPI